VAQMVRAFAKAGAAAVCLADAQYPRHNSLRSGRLQLVSAPEFAQKLAAAKQSQRKPDLLVIARLESLIARTGLHDAQRRARAYAEAGADAILIHSRQCDPAEVLEFVEAWDGHLPLVLIPTTYHTLTEQHLCKTNKVKMVIYANQGIRAAIRAMRTVLAQIRAEGTAHGVENAILSLDELFAIQDRFPPPKQNSRLSYKRRQLVPGHLPEQER
jgi:phosphoenolpyruvate phosphomutase